ncbi:MAG: hypothetical protein FD133_1481 [Erysipelotrichaceae bacterium]|nr:MAG: hypothetical protein FD179_1718 [Erysipelotrichaceae bacterium]TXT17241.1 MAG: hypothetical protein FD133_1481 [Erysipelotrichaceae bacterium]
MVYFVKCDMSVTFLIKVSFFDYTFRPFFYHIH